MPPGFVPGGIFYSVKSSLSNLWKSGAFGFTGIRLKGSYKNFRQAYVTLTIPRLVHSI